MDSDAEEDEVQRQIAHQKELVQRDARREKMRRKELKAVDHAAVDYAPFRKRFYIVPREVAALSRAEVAAARGTQDGTRLRDLSGEARDAVHARDEAAVPLWHHKLLRAWCAAQPPPAARRVTVTP